MRLTNLAAGAAILSLAISPALAAPGKHNPAARLSLANAKAPAAPRTDTADAETPPEGSGGPSTRTLLIAGAVGAAVVVGAVALGDNDDETPASM